MEVLLILVLVSMLFPAAYAEINYAVLYRIKIKINARSEIDVSCNNV